MNKYREVFNFNEQNLNDVQLKKGERVYIPSQQQHLNVFIDLDALRIDEINTNCIIQKAFKNGNLTVTNYLAEKPTTRRINADQWHVKKERGEFILIPRSFNTIT